MILLPPNLGILGSICGDRFAQSGVQLRIEGTSYRAAATDGKIAAQIAGQEVDNPDNFPAVPGLADAPDGKTEGVIPAGEWAKVFKGIPKRSAKLVIKSAAVKLSEHEATFATTNLESGNVTRSRLLDGRFPELASAMPKGEPKMSIRLSPQKLIDLLKVCAVVNAEEVLVEVYHPGKPVVLRSVNGEQSLLGLIMPRS